MLNSQSARWTSRIEEAITLTHLNVPLETEVLVHRCEIAMEVWNSEAEMPQENCSASVPKKTSARFVNCDTDGGKHSNKPLPPLTRF